MKMEDEPISNEKRNKSSDRRKARKRFPYRRTYHKGNSPIPEYPNEIDKTKV